MTRKNSSLIGNNSSNSNNNKNIKTKRTQTINNISHEVVIDVWYGSLLSTL